LNLDSNNNWLVVEPTPEKYEFVSWDDEIPNIWKVLKAMFQTTNQRSI
jgi:hypothetical protein